MTQPKQAGLIRKGIDAVKAGIDAFRKSAPLKEEGSDYSPFANNLKLIDAIIAGDCAKVKEAIDKGADVNSWNLDTTDARLKAPSRPAVEVRIPTIRPLALARKLGRDDIAQLLREHGATE